MQELLPLAEKVATLLKDRRATIAVAESSTGGLISAALLAVPGASSYFLGGAVIYTGAARKALLDIPDEALTGMRASTEAYAAPRAHGAPALLHHMRPGREWRDRTDGQPVWRRRRPWLPRGCRADRSRDHAGNR